MPIGNLDSFETVTIPIDVYNEREKAIRWLNCLEAAGVDNWSGYEYAQELYEEAENEATP